MSPWADEICVGAGRSPSHRVGVDFTPGALGRVWPPVFFLGIELTYVFLGTELAYVIFGIYCSPLEKTEMEKVRCYAKTEEEIPP